MFVKGDNPEGASPGGHPAQAGSSGPANLAAIPLEHLEHQICELASHIQAGTAHWLELVAEFDRRQGWGSWGCRSCADWVSWRCARAPRAAREHVRIARALQELPLIRAAFRRGELSYSKVRAISRVATEANESELIELAGQATAAQLERILRGHRLVRRIADGASDPESYLSWCWDDDGSLRFRGRLPAEDGALLLKALEAARDALRERAWQEQGGSAEPHQGAQCGSAEPLAAPMPTNADALAAVAEASLASAPAELRGGERNQLVVHVDLDVLAHDREGRSHLRDGPYLAPETARRLGCDSAVVSSLERDGQALSVGRRTRTIPPVLRRALEVRDPTCRFPGCERKRFLDGHHIHHWAKGGETALPNLVLLCRHHHRLLHEGGFRVESPRDGPLVFYRPDGTPIDAGTCLTGSGERFDLGLAVDRVLAIEAKGGG